MFLWGVLDISSMADNPQQGNWGTDTINSSSGVMCKQIFD